MTPPAESKMNSVIVPAAGDHPATLYVAADRPLRVMVRNAGGPILFLSYESSTLEQPVPGIVGTYALPPGASDVFVLMPRQGLWAVAVGAGGVASIAVSEALPQVWMES